jgi:hypothetical protein
MIYSTDLYYNHHEFKALTSKQKNINPTPYTRLNSTERGERRRRLLIATRRREGEGYSKTKGRLLI